MVSVIHIIGKLDKEEEKNIVIPLPTEKSILGYVLSFSSPLCTVKEHYF